MNTDALPNKGLEEPFPGRVPFPELGSVVLNKFVPAGFPVGIKKLLLGKPKGGNPAEFGPPRP